jgi:hypothetical protein
MRIIEAGANAARKRGYTTNSSLAGISFLARRRSGRRIKHA